MKNPFRMVNGEFWDERLANRAGTVCFVLGGLFVAAAVARFFVFVFQKSWAMGSFMLGMLLIGCGGLVMIVMATLDRHES